MPFNSWTFLYFVLLTLFAYWAFYKKPFFQNLVLLGASYFFYGWMHPLFPLYLFALTAIGYLSALIVSGVEARRKKGALILSLILASASLAVLKYANFFIDSINSFSFEGLSPLQLLVPVGLSFYTFSTIGYIVDVYRQKRPAEKNFITYSTYISFFPHLLAGPIPTSTEILPQFEKRRKIGLTDVEDAAGQIIWGLFKKMVVADNIGLVVNYCFAHAASLNGLSLYIGIVLFSFQIYADFSGYSEIARGVARLFGIDLFQNFRLPFFSRNPAEFWRRWHVSLMHWLSSYIYIPLGGRSRNTGRYLFVLLTTFTFSGLWHGANWTFVLWGLLNGLYFIPYVLTNTLTRYKEVVAPERALPTLRELGQMLITFHLITLSRVLFKAKNLQQAGLYFKGLLGLTGGTPPGTFLLSNLKWCAFLIVVEWIQRRRDYILDFRLPKVLKFTLYLAVIALIFFYHKKQSLQEYYYFRF